MKLSFPFTHLFIVETEITLDFRKTGLAVGVHSKTAGLPKVSATLLLRWTEILLIVGLLVVGSLIVHFRAQLAATHFIAVWAPAHLTITVTGLAVLAFIVGCFVTLWKKKQLFTYGIAEIAFALFAVVQIGLHLWPQGKLADFVALGSALYVVSRGLGNLWDAFVQETALERLKLQVG